MTVSRRDVLTFLGAGSLLAIGPSATGAEESTLYGLIGRIDAVSGQRDALASVLLEGASEMPGCMSYVVAHDVERADALWITEVWESAEAHRASLSLESVQRAIERGRPMIAGFGERFETTPIGGHGLVPAPGEG